jgi:hypothetical protein
MDCDEPHLAPNEKMHPIQWIERPTGALVAAGSLCPIEGIFRLNSQTEFGTKATGIHRALNGHSFQVGTKAH